MNNSFFTWRGAILKSGLAPTTRHVLLTLGCHMNDVGESCYPSIDLLCEETGLSNRAVITHLHKASEAGWIEISRHGFGDSRYWRNEYKIRWPSPENLTDLSERGSPTTVNDVHQVNSDLSERGSPTTVNDVHTSTSYNSSDVFPTIVVKTSPREKNNPSKNSSATTEGILACRLIKLNVAVTSIHPTLCRWITDKIPIDFIEQCVDLARMNKPWPEKISAGYLDAIIRNELKPKVDNSWLMSDEATIAKGREIGIDARAGESMSDYRQRLKDYLFSANAKAA